MRLAGLAAALALAGAPGAAAAQNVVIALSPGEVLLNVEAEGRHRSHPDVMTVTAGVVTTARTAREALTANSAQANRLVDMVRGRGIEPRDVRTTELRVVPQFEELSDAAAEAADREGREPRILGYVASNKLELRLRDLAKAPDLIDALFAAGANSVQGPEFSLSDPTPAEREARRSAVAAARLEADTYAEALGMRIARVLRVSERGAFDSDEGNHIVVTGSRIRGAPIQPGELTTRINVWIDYAMVPR